MKKDFSIPFTYQGVTRYTLTTVNEIEGEGQNVVKSSYFGIGVLIALIIIAEVI